MKIICNLKQEKIYKDIKICMEHNTLWPWDLDSRTTRKEETRLIWIVVNYGGYWNYDELIRSVINLKDSSSRYLLIKRRQKKNIKKALRSITTILMITYTVRHEQLANPRLVAETKSPIGKWWTVKFLRRNAAEVKSVLCGEQLPHNLLINQQWLISNG